jgi:hypothetical protein
MLNQFYRLSGQLLFTSKVQFTVLKASILSIHFQQPEIRDVFQNIPTDIFSVSFEVSTVVTVRRDLDCNIMWTCGS